MRRRFLYFLPLLQYLGGLFWVFGFVLLVPIVVLLGSKRQGLVEVPVSSFIVPALLAFSLGAILNWKFQFPGLDGRRAMLFCALAWLAVSALAALPFAIGLPHVGFAGSYLNGFFESVSGFTTTGITMYTHLDQMPRSIIFWRALMQWLGGLGILTFFLVVATNSNSAHNLFSAESHKIVSKRPTPGFFSTVRYLWLIYIALTLLTVGALYFLDLSMFDAIAHAFTTISTGGFSPYDASIAHFRNTGYAHATAIEYVIIAGMLLGGMNFLVHFRCCTGDFKALWDSLEIRWWWIIIAGATLSVGLDRMLSFGLASSEPLWRDSLFQVTAILTSTGYATQTIATSWAPSLAKLIFLSLMVIGGCVGSTSGGIKVLRVAILWKMLRRQITKVMYGKHVVAPIMVDERSIEIEEIRRIAALFFGWMLLLMIGSFATALLSNFGPLESASGMFSALGNIGPCYIPSVSMGNLNPLIKIIYIIGMLAGRLEILPILLLFSRRAWR